MKRIGIDEEPDQATNRCVHCGCPLEWVDEVGWVDLTRDGSYDMCPNDPYDNHAPGPLAG